MWSLAREADAKPGRLAGQVPCRWRSRSSEGLGVAVGVPALDLGIRLGNELLQDLEIDFR